MLKAIASLRLVHKYNKSSAIEILVDTAEELVERAIRVDLNVPHE